MEWNEEGMSREDRTETRSHPPLRVLGEQI